LAALSVVVVAAAVVAAKARSQATVVPGALVDYLAAVVAAAVSAHQPAQVELAALVRPVKYGYSAGKIDSNEHQFP
jgi:xanthine/uracil permease